MSAREIREFLVEPDPNGFVSEYHPHVPQLDLGFDIRLRIGAGTRIIGPRAFESNPWIREIVFPESLQAIHSEAFRGCTRLESIVLPKSTRLIGSFAFAYCWRLHTVHLPASLSFEDPFILFGCQPAVLSEPTLRRDYENTDIRRWLGIPDQNGFVINGNTLEGYFGSAETVTVPDHVQAIATGAFDHPQPPDALLPKQVCLPKQLKSLALNYRFLDNPMDISLPGHYLQQPFALQQEMTAAMLDGPWFGQAKLADYAALYLFQGPDLAALAEERIASKDRTRAASLMLDQVSASPSRDALTRTVSFFLRFSDSISPAQFLQLSDIIDQWYGKETDFGATRTANLTDAGENLFCPESVADFVFNIAHIRPRHPAFSKVLRKDGKCASPLLIKNILVPYLAQAMIPKLKRRADLPFLECNFVPQADKLASRLNPASFQAAMDEIFPKPTRKLPKHSEWLVPLCRFGSEKQLENVVRLLKELKSAVTGAAGLTARGALLLSETLAAASWAAASASGKLQPMDPYILLRLQNADRHPLLPDSFDLSDQGTGAIAAAGQSYDLKIEDGRLLLRNQATDKVSFRLPAQGQMPADVKQRITAISHYAEHLPKALRRMCVHDYISGTARPYRVWQQLAENPMTTQFLCGLVWQQGELTFIFTDGKPTDADGNAVSVSEAASVQVAHPRDIAPETAAIWQLYSKRSDQPPIFDQFRVPIYTEAVASDRFTGYTVDWDTLRVLDFADLFVAAPGGRNAELVRYKHAACTIAGRETAYRSRRLELGQLHLREQNRESDYLIWVLDLATAIERAARNDVSSVKRLRNAPSELLREALEAATDANASETAAALLEVLGSRISGGATSRDDIRL